MSFKRLTTWLLLAALLTVAGATFAQTDATPEPTDDGMMTDDMMMGMMAEALFVTLNPGDVAQDAVVRVTGDLATTEATFGGFTNIASIQSVKLTARGHAYITVDVEEGLGGLLYVQNIATGDDATVRRGARLVSGSFAGLVNPKGLHIIEEMDLVLVANFGAANIKGWALNADGNVTPSLLIEDFGGVGGSIWDVHYDPTTDTLFAAGTTGFAFVYAGFSTTLGQGGPTSIITPSDAEGNQISINLHGIDYDPATDTLFLTDVGSADSNTDGQVFTIANALSASGNVPVAAWYAGDASQLGNPVDLVFDGTFVYVAEKANDLMLRYDNLVPTMDMGMMDGNMMAAGAPTNAPADVVVTFLKPESVALAGDYLMRLNEAMMMGMGAMDMMMTEEAMDDMMATEEATPAS